MAQMNRNVNLEEINSDALFGIDALKNQTIVQKIVFFGSVIAGVLTNVCLPIFLDTPRLVCIFIFMVLLLVGVAFGCNYTEDMTYGKYLYFFFFKPSKHLTFRSTEDVAVVKKKAMKIKKEEEMMLKRQQQADPVQQRKLLVKLIVFVLTFVVVISGILIYASSGKEENRHHIIDVTEMEEVDGTAE